MRITPIYSWVFKVRRVGDFTLGALGLRVPERERNWVFRPSENSVEVEVKYPTTLAFLTGTPLVVRPGDDFTLGVALVRGDNIRHLDNRLQRRRVSWTAFGGAWDSTTLAAADLVRENLPDNSLGTAWLTLQAPENAGIYVVRARFEGDGEHMSCENAVEIWVWGGKGYFTLSLGRKEVVVGEGESASLTVQLMACEGFMGKVELGVEGLSQEVQASFSRNPVYLMSSTSSILTLRLKGSPQRVKNQVRVVATGPEGVRREAEFMLYAFGGSWIGTVALDRNPKHDDTDEDEDSGGLIHSADAFAPLTGDGYVYAKTDAQIWAGARAQATQLVYFTPKQSGPITVEARLQVRSFIHTGAELLGIANGETSGHVYLNGERHIRLFEEEWAFDVPVELLPVAGEILRIIKDTVDTMQELAKLIEYIQNYSSFEERVVRYTWDVGGGQTYTVGGGVSSGVAAKLVAEGKATVVGCVDSIKVWNGTAPVIEYKFNEGWGNIANDSSGLNLNASITGGSWTSGLTSGALDFDSPDPPTGYKTCFDMNDLWNLEGISFEAWVKPRKVKRAPIVNLFVKTGRGIFWAFQFWQETTDDGRFFFGGCGPLSSNLKYFWVGSYEADKEWYHVVSTYNQGPANWGIYTDASWSFFIDGVPIVSESNVGGFSLSGGVGGVGDAMLGGGGLGGLIEEVRIYPRALSGDEIRARYRAGPSL